MWYAWNDSGRGHSLRICYHNEVNCNNSVCSLQSGGHVYYLGMGTPGVMAIIDASECPPTFGVEYGTVRGFISGGYATLGNTAGSLAEVSHVILM